MTFEVVYIYVFLSVFGQQSYLHESLNDEVAIKACSPERPAIITEPGVLLQPLINENGTYELNQTCHWLLHAPTGAVSKFCCILRDWLHSSIIK